MKPLYRGYIAQIAFFLALSGCAVLVFQSKAANALFPNIIYSLTLIGMYGISALYHRPMWSRQKYLLMRSIDHAAIFALIAGTATPVCLIGLKNQTGLFFLCVIWGIAIVGMLLTIFWTQGPKWIRSLLYVILGWLVIPYFSEIQFKLGMVNFELLLAGGIFYTLGALVYAFKRPNPYPNVFGYHEIFHALIVIASLFHFIVIYNLTLLQ
ncbi:MAG: hemolysin III family protein [Gammaproteobacteria bacterium]